MRIGALLAGPIGWLGIVYLGSLAVLLVASFWTLDEFTGLTVKTLSFDNFRTIIEEPVYRRIVLRTVSIAALVTITDIVLAFPIALYMAWVARPRVKAAMVVAVLMPLWASYLVKVYAWRTMFAHDGILNWFGDPFGLSVPESGYIRVWIVLSYLWLPYMILPIYAGLERIQSSLLDASEDLGARPWRTFRSLVLPLCLPAVAARVDLHVLAVAGRLHHAPARLQYAVHRQRRLRQRGHREQPAAGGRVRDGAGGDHDLLPAPGPAGRGVRRPLMRVSGGARWILRVGHRVHAWRSSTRR